MKDRPSSSPSRWNGWMDVWCLLLTSTKEEKKRGGTEETLVGCSEERRRKGSREEKVFDFRRNIGNKLEKTLNIRVDDNLLKDGIGVANDVSLFIEHEGPVLERKRGAVRHAHCHLGDRHVFVLRDFDPGYYDAIKALIDGLLEHLKKVLTSSRRESMISSVKGRKKGRKRCV